jgi:hypothetical protein
MVKRLFVSGFAADAKPCSGSVHTVIMDSAIAAPLATTQPGSNNCIAPTATTSRVRKDAWIIATANGNTASGRRSRA